MMSAVVLVLIVLNSVAVVDFVEMMFYYLLAKIADSVSFLDVLELECKHLQRLLRQVPNFYDKMQLNSFRMLLKYN